MAGASSFSAFLGITEPAIFGVNLRLRYAFFVGMGAAALGGLLVALLGIRSTALGAAGYLGFPSISPADSGWLKFFVSLVVVTIASFLFTYLLTVRRNRRLDANAEAAAVASAATPAADGDDAESGRGTAGAAGTDQEDWRLTAPLTGRAMELSEVSDPTFAQAMLGPGAAIQPEEDVLRAPADATVTVAFPTGHAYGLRTAGGLDLLIHLGFDTVELDGKHFRPKVAQGDVVRRGDVLAEFDAAAIRAEGYDLATPIVVTNAKKIEGIRFEGGVRAGAHVVAGEDFLQVDPKVDAGIA